MKISLSLKMLLLTLGSFLILIFGIIASLFLYFSRFYEPEKINNMIHAINEFTGEFEKNQWSDDKLYSEVSKFMKTQNATMSIQPENLWLTTSASPVAALSSSPDFFILNNYSLSTDLLLDLLPKLHIDQSLRPSVSFRVVQNSPLSMTPFMIAEQGSIGTATSINGTLVLYPITISNTDFNSGTTEIHTKNGVTYTISTIPYTNYRQVNFTKQSTLSNGETKVTNVNLSLQSVDEVTQYLIRFFPFLIAAAVGLSLIMVVVYSKTISKPIVKITKTANRMANMELGIRSNVKRKDELGALSDSLNTLSGNLKYAMDELSSANQQLKTDYESELRQEKARKEFVANVSHELKTPLGIIRSYTEGIRDGVKAEKKDYYMEVILNEISHMDQLLLEMLEISKLDAGAVTYKKNPENFDLLLNKTIRTFIYKAQEKEVIFDVTGEFGSVLIDMEKIGRVLNNLIGNAVKYCNPASVITITGERTAQSLNVRIENDCPPFSEEVLRKIWDRFYKADTSHNRDTEGTGLGLAIAKSILEGHGCPYGVHNTGRGICFYFTMETQA